MRLSPRFLVSAALLFMAAVGNSSAHDLPHGLQGQPKPPPTVDPGPNAARLRIRIVDAKSGEPVSATVCVNDGAQEPDDDPLGQFSLRRSANRHKGEIRLRRLSYYFFADGACEVRVPPGPTVFEVRKGYEYRPVEVTLVAPAKGTVDLEVRLERSIEMASLGWYSGDPHVHLERTGTNDPQLLAITSARDIRYAYLLSMNTSGYDLAGPKYESVRQHTGLGDRTAASRGIYHITSGQEYRASRLGHVILALPDRPVPAGGETANTNAGPALAVIAEQTHALNGFIGLAHGGYVDQEADALILEQKIDYLELLQFGEYRSLGLAGWYDFLNLGYRLPIVGASDFPSTRELSSEITYVWSDTVPTPRTFAEGLRAGRSFSTSGPLLFLAVAGERPGARLQYEPGAAVTLPVELRVHSPQYPVRYLDLIVNGEVIERRFAPEGRSEWTLHHHLPLRGSSWIAARAYGDAGTDSHTNPIYVYRGDALPFDPASARRILARLDGSMAAVGLPAVVTKLGQLKAELEARLRDPRQTRLPKPQAGR